MNKLSLVVCILTCAVANVQAYGEVSVEGLAVLQRVADMREQSRDYSVELEYEIIREGIRCYRIHSLGDKLLVEEYEGTLFADENRISTTLIHGNEAWFYVHSSHADLEKTTRAKVDNAGSNAFSPHTLGLVFILNLQDDLPSSLYTNADSIALLQSEDFNGVTVEHVEVQRGDFVIGYRINVDSGRVYQAIAFQDHAEYSRVESDYDVVSQIEWLPSQVTISFANSNRTDIIRNIRCISLNPSPDLFLLSSLDIPKDTAVVDRDIAQKIGHWNGTEIVTEQDYHSSQMPNENSGPWYIFGILVIVFALVAVAIKSVVLRRR